MSFMTVHWLSKLKSFTLLFTVFCLTHVAIAETRSVIIYGAGNYDDQAGAPDLEIYHLGNSQFQLPQPGAAPNKRDILKWNVTLAAKMWPNDRIHFFVNDIAEAAALKAAQVIENEAKMLHLRFAITVVSGDFSQIPLPSTDLALLDNPEEVWFYDPKTGKPFSDRQKARSQFKVLNRLASKARQGLFITTYYHDGIKGLARLIPFELQQLGEGFPYIWPDGHIDERSTTRYQIQHCVDVLE